jgi:hypothetical protein
MLTRILTMRTARLILVFLVLTLWAEIVQSSARLHRDEDNLLKLTTPLKFGGETLEITFPATTTGALVMAKQFCDQRSERAGIALEDINELCVRPIGDLLVGILNKQLGLTKGDNEPTQVILDISGNQVEIQMTLGTDSPSQIATNFCRENSERLRINERECLVAVTARLEEVERNALTEKHRRTSKQAAKPIESTYRSVDVIFDDNKSHTVTFRPKHETTSSAAKKFCVSKRIELGIKFSELNSKCIEVVQRALDESA